MTTSMPYQQLVMNAQGTVLESSGTLIELSHHAKDTLIENLPFLESILNTWHHIPTPPDEVQFNGVHATSINLNGIFDFKFLNAQFGDESVIVCTIIDQTKKYLDKQKKQQIENEIALDKQKNIKSK